MATTSTSQALPFGFRLELDFHEFELMAEMMDAAADQLPYALSRAMNESLVGAREVMTRSSWPSHVQQRNTAFLGSALRMEFSRKDNLRASIFTPDPRKGTIVQRQAVGGSVRAKRKALALPLKSWVTRTARGVIASQKLQALKARTPARAARDLATGFFVGEAGRLHLKYSYKSSVTQTARVPLYEDFALAMSQGLRTGFEKWMTKAMQSRRSAR